MAANLQVDLCTVADVVGFLGGSVSADAQLEIQFLVTACSQAAASFCSRNFITRSYTEARNGTGTSSIVLRESPVTAITSVYIGTLPIPAGAPGGSVGYLIDDGILYLLNGPPFPRGVQNVVVSYTAGYTDLTNPATSTIPMDLRQAIVEAVSVTFKRRQNLGVSSKTIAGESISYILSQWPASSKAVLGYYQKAAYG